MLDVYGESYYRMYDGSMKVENKLGNFALITFFDRESKSYSQSEVKIDGATLIGMIESKTPDMVSVVLYSRKIGLLDDFEVYGRPENIGRTIYFGKMMSVAEYNNEFPEHLSLPIDKRVCLLDCGEVLTEIEPGSDTSENVLKQYNKCIAHNLR